ncbi:MAG: phosphoenolpyruvate carboxykinase (ATP) [Planctomycetia bacterium]|nr:phosphoenolpyruvate carboxykinase (ATP) [Planctomycetia bacterium]
MESFDLRCHGISVRRVLRNAPPARLYEDAVLRDKGLIVTSGALLSHSGAKTGRSPKDKRIVDHPDSSRDVWWGDINIQLDEHTFFVNHQRAIDYLDTRDILYVVDGFAGWDPRYRVKVRVICARPYHAIFMHNMLIRPTPAELALYGEPDFIIYNAGEFPANVLTSRMTSRTSIDISFERGEVVILGTEYAGEMKKGVFTIMNYLMPKRGVLSMHCSANEGNDDDVSLFFGLSGTGKTTLSADPRRRLIGDDEHCWTDQGVFNIEGGCYAKCIGLSAAEEPEIHEAIRFGSVLENVAYDEATREPKYDDASLTENTRACYPIEFIPNAKIPCRGGHPSNIIFLTADAFGVLPPVSKLSTAQAMYYFMSGYTAKVAGTEQGVTEPVATFSACFGAAFMVWHPTKYATLLAERIRAHQAQVWLVNTGWSGGAFGAGLRIKLAHTRAIIDAIHSGALTRVDTTTEPQFGLEVPLSCPGVPDNILQPKNTWGDPAAYQRAAGKLVGLFRKNFAHYEKLADEEVKNAGPRAGEAVRG